MENLLYYKGFTGSLEFSEADRIYHGRVQGIESLISYEGENTEELEKDFRDAVDDYLELCESRGTEPEKAVM
jgi:predicted HicB family RNase H-like nuclease